MRDGFYIQSSSHGTIRGNVARDLRYGLHYMFSDDNVFEDNLFENGAAGAALMYSKRIVFRRNRFLHNRGFASVGLLFKACDDVVAEDNLIADNARGIFLEGSYRNIVPAQRRSRTPTPRSCSTTRRGGNRFEGNSFVGEHDAARRSSAGAPTRSSTGNYWSENDEPDLDGDGRSDRPYRLTSVFDHFRGNLTAADLMAQGLRRRGARRRRSGRSRCCGPIPVEDHAPLVRPPVLPRVPARGRAQPRAANARGPRWPRSAALGLGRGGRCARGRP